MKFKTERIVGIFVLLALAILLYAVVKIGFVSLDRSKYRTFFVSFSNISGLIKKDEVRVAGVKVGWIENIKLISNGACSVSAEIRVSKDCFLYKNVQAAIRQDGMMGRKYLEILPGDHNLALARKGSVIPCSKDFTQDLENVFNQVQDVASDLNKVVASLRKSFIPEDGKKNAFEIFSSRIDSLLDSFYELVNSINLLAKENTEIIQAAAKDSAEIIKLLKVEVPELIRTLKNLAGDMQREVIPSVRAGVEKVSSSVDENLTRLSENFEKVRKNFGSITQKVSEGKGAIGKLLTDEDLCKDVEATVNCLGRSVSRLREVCFGVMSEFEGLISLENDQDQRDEIFKDCKTDFKFHLNGFLSPTPSTLVLGGLVARDNGKIRHKDIFEKMKSNKDLNLLSRRSTRYYDRLLWNLQLGGRPSDYFLLRGGFFESTLGLGLDFCVQFRESCLKLISSFEAYDFKGRLRLDDDSVHLRWINRFFLGPYLHCFLGLDDFSSRWNKSFMFGLGFSYGFD